MLLSRLPMPGQRNPWACLLCDLQWVETTEYRRVLCCDATGLACLTHRNRTITAAGEDVIPEWGLVAPLAIEPVAIGTEVNPDHARAVAVVPEELARARRLTG